MRIINLLLNSKITLSIAESRRLLDAGRIKIGDRVVQTTPTEPNPEVEINDGDIVTIGRVVTVFSTENQQLNKITKDKA